MAGELVWKHIKLTDTIARRLGLDAALVAGIGLEALQKAESTFDETKGVKFSSYARDVIEKKYIDYMRENPIILDFSNCNSQLDITSGHNSRIGSGQNESEPVFTNRDIESLRKLLSDEEYSLLRRYYVDGDSMQRIADDLGVVRQWVWLRIKKITEKVKGC